LRLPGDTDLSQHPAQLAGAIEVQDAGSQWIAALCAVKPGMTVVDLCAGGGGKTLALAAMMQGEGRIIACDVDRARLSQLMPRAERAGVAALVETRLLNPNREMEQLADLVQQADIVLVDAPCSGTGTWRRNPEARWRLNPARLDRLKTMQRHVIDLAANLVASGGAMVYAVCSVLREEGDEQMVDWLTAHADWRVDDSVSLPVGRMLRTGRLLTPLHDATDGFFMARIDRV
jgi:16S rRNA (cytosine967-C5)-methyltransferase